MVFTHVGDDVRVGDRPGGRAGWPLTQKSRLEVMCTFVGGRRPCRRPTRGSLLVGTDTEKSSPRDFRIRGDDVRVGD